MRIIKQEQINIISQEMALNCTITISVRENDAEKVNNIFHTFNGVVITEI